MGRLVVVSNRVANWRKAAAAGGLAVALGEALAVNGGLWFGWSSTVVEGSAPGEGDVHTQHAGNVTLNTLDLSRDDHESYYLGYGNGVLRLVLITDWIWLILTLATLVAISA